MHHQPRGSNIGKKSDLQGGGPVGLMYASCMPHVCLIYPRVGGGVVGTHSDSGDIDVGSLAAFSAGSAPDLFKEASTVI